MAHTVTHFSGVANETGNYQTTKLYYTGKNINATNGSRTAISGVVPVGACVVFDPYGHDQGKGHDVTQPQTNFLNIPAGIVVGGSPTTIAEPGYIEVVSMANYIEALVLGNLTAPIDDTTAAQRLGPVAGQWYLGIITKSVASADANTAALLKCIAHSWATQNNASAALTPVRLSTLGGIV